MAQTKARPKPKGGAAKPKSRSKPKSAAKPKSQSKPRSRSAKAPSGSSNGSGSTQAGNGSPAAAASRAAGKAKIPLLAGGAALIGAAGGLAYGATHSGGKVMGVRMPRPKRVQLRSADLKDAAKDIGHFGDQLGAVAAELRGRGGNGDGASPVEVLLRALTARR